MPRRKLATLLAVLATGALVPAEAGARDGMGFRVGLSQGPDQLVLGGQGEFGPVLGSASFSPKLDVGLGDPATVVMFHGDLRWYLLPLPDTALRIYGEAGPGLALAPDVELGLNLTAGIDIPMKRGRRYNVEVRFGFGDVPDLKVVLGVLFRP